MPTGFDISDLTEDTNPNTTDLAYSLRDPAGTPLDRKVTWLNIFKAMGLSILTTNGDLLTRTAGALARLTRADLAADSAFTAAYQPLMLLDEEILSGSAASVTFASIPGTYSDLVVRAIARGTDAAAAVSINVTFNGDTGSNYDRQSLLGSAASASASEGLGATSMALVSIAAAGATADVASSFVFEIPAYKGTTFQKSAIVSNAHKTGTATGNVFIIARAGHWRSTAAITSITLTPSAGSFATGSQFRLYGLR